LKWHCLLLVEIFLPSFSFEVTLYTVGEDLSVTVQFWSDIVYCWRRSSCHRLVLKWHCLLLVEIFLSPFSFEVTLFTVGEDLPVTVQFWSDIVYFWWRSSCHCSVLKWHCLLLAKTFRHRLVLKWHCLLLVEIFLSPFSFEVTLFTVGENLPVTIQFWSDIVYCWRRFSCHYLLLKWHCLLLVEIFLSSFSFEVTLFTVGGDLPVIVQYWSDIVYSWRRSSCHRLVLKWHCLLLVEIFMSSFSFEVTLFTVGGDLPAIVQFWSDIVHCWWRSSCHRSVLKWHCLLLPKIFLSPFSSEVTLFTVGGDLPVTIQFWSYIVYCWRRSSCHRSVLKWHCLLLVEFLLSPFSFEVTLFTVCEDLPVTV